MRPEGLALYHQRKDQEGYSAVSKNVELIKEYEDEIKNNLKAWEFFEQLSASYKRDSIWWIMSAKKEETRLRRLNRLIASWEKEEWFRP
ncbi:MAG: YdeI/OmpD-associated family protein [Vagococcus sp.]|uniref:YdeI/OmpD-associated family protein n=1 Tax=Vagococcus sp. TaxID=1933889 RepID=UPI002FC90380